MGDRWSTWGRRTAPQLLLSPQTTFLTYTNAEKDYVWMDIIPITTQFIHYLLQEPLHPSLLQVVLSAFLQAMSTLDFMRQNRVVIFRCGGEEGSSPWKPWVMQSSHNSGTALTEWHVCPLTKQWWRPRVAKMWTLSANDGIHLHSTTQPVYKKPLISSIFAHKWDNIFLPYSLKYSV